MSWKIATWNVNSLKARHEHVLTWLAESKVDILALQELKALAVDQEFINAVSKLGYHLEYVGQKAYNGVAIISKIKSSKRPIKFLVHAPENQARFLALDFNNLTVVCVYVPNGSEVGSEKYHYKLAWLDALEAWLSAKIKPETQLLLLGDFNIAPNINDTYEPKLWEGKVLASEPERLRYQNIISTGLDDTYIKIVNPEDRFTWWDYRAGAFQKNNGCRIDLILATRECMAKLIELNIDNSPRAWDKPSDHCPVIATFEGEVA